MKPINRLAWYLKVHNIRFSTVERELGLGKGYLGKQVRSEGSIGSGILEKICSAYPGINPSWLLTGQGTYNNKGHETPPTEPENRLAFIDQLPITDREKYELCRLLVQKLALKLEVLQKRLNSL